jgi:hypothetical protein
MNGRPRELALQKASWQKEKWGPQDQNTLSPVLKTHRIKLTVGDLFLASVLAIEIHSTTHRLTAVTNDAS